MTRPFSPLGIGAGWFFGGWFLLALMSSPGLIVGVVVTLVAIVALLIYGHRITGPLSRLAARFAAARARRARVTHP